MSYKFGRRAARHNLRTLRSGLAMAKSLSALGTPPTVSEDYVTPLLNAVKGLATAPGGNNGEFGMFLNDSLGDCVCADTAHQVMLHTANANGIVVPTNDDVLALYEAVGGYKPGDPRTDNGCDETSMCDYLMANGLAGQKSAGAGMIDPTNLDHIRWAVQLFGACRLGIIVDNGMISLFDAEQPWSQPVSPTGGDAGGHDVPVVKYDADYAYVVTWGGLQAVAWSLMANPAFLEEAHAEVWPDFIAATGNAPNGFSLQQLLGDLPELKESDHVWKVGRH